MTDEDTVLVCRRVTDLPEPPVESELWDCAVCGEAVWVARSSPKAEHIYCLSCAADEIKNEVVSMTEEQLADVAAYFNRRRQ
jgi:formylmethanofuran dehydrogenase subunit E